MTESFDHLKLCKADAEMLDQLVDVGFEIDQLEYLSPEEEQRARKHSCDARIARSISR